jgi:hypothetical protein
MTHAELIQQLQAIRYPCQGPLPTAARVLVNQLAQHTETRAVASVIDRANRGRTDDEPIVIQLVAPDDPALPLIALLSNGHQEPYRPRPLCGANFLPALLVAGPFDGVVRSYRCPRCGVSGLYAPPLLESSAG